MEPLRATLGTLPPSSPPAQTHPLPPFLPMASNMSRHRGPGGLRDTVHHQGLRCRRHTRLLHLRRFARSRRDVSDARELRDHVRLQPADAAARHVVDVDLAPVLVELGQAAASPAALVADLVEVGLEPAALDRADVLALLVFLLDEDAAAVPLLRGLADAGGVTVRAAERR